MKKYFFHRYSIIRQASFRIAIVMWLLFFIGSVATQQIIWVLFAFAITWSGIFIFSRNIKMMRRDKL
ncbi:MAG: hypothetical protein AABY15_06415 [Nanoarchaeota archaeon]